ncbi:MAG: hypothetical protein QOH67_1810 [Hyphomicrobiales bacterium]|jgi:uncharacterized membrane protein YccC|nr:hypothetical protein [Hyphomicrobiales bacterium]
MSAGVEQSLAQRTPAAGAWKRLRTKVRDHGAQLRLCLRVTVAAVAAFILAQVFTAPLAGLWAVLTAVLVTQMSLGASVTATIEYFVGTLGGAIYAAAIAVLIPYHGEISLLVVIALAVAPLAFLAAVNPHFRVGPFTAVIVVLGATATHIGPLESAFYRVMEVALGGVTGLAVSLVVLPARAQGLAIKAAADMLDLLAHALASLATGFVHDANAVQVRELQDSIGAAFARVEAVAAEASRERYLATPPDPGRMLHTLLRQRHDLVMIGRAAAAPLPGPLQMRLGPPLARVVEVAANYLRACSAALLARRAAPSLDVVGAALREYAAAIAAARREQLAHDLSVDEVERIFALSFAFEQLHADFIDLAGRVNELAQSKGAKAG